MYVVLKIEARVYPLLSMYSTVSMPQLTSSDPFTLILPFIQLPLLFCLWTSLDTVVEPIGSQFLPVPFLPQATDALYEVLIGNRLREAAFRLFPQLLMALLIQIHHSVGLTMSDVSIPSGLYAGQEIPTEVTPLWYCSL